MMRSNYISLAAEEWIYEVYQENGIISPDDLDIELIAGIWNIEIIYSNISRPFARWDSSAACIFLPNRLPEIDQRAAFFHEFGHVLLHVGNQRKMPQLFRDLQENQAGRFRLYASMPYPMIKPLLSDLSLYEIAEEFKLPIDLVSRRMEQIESKLIECMDPEQASVRDLRKQKWSQETIEVLHQLNHILLNKQHYRYYGA